MLKSRIPQIAIELELIVDERLQEGAEDVRERAEERLEPHRLTGRLQEATHVDKQPEGVYVVAGGKAQGDDVFWGAFLEHGTTKNPPYPFLVPALEENRDHVVGLVRRGLERL